MLAAEQFSISLFPACGISGSDRLLSFHSVSLSVQAGSVFFDMKFSRTLWVAHYVTRIHSFRHEAHAQVIPR